MSDFDPAPIRASFARQSMMTTLGATMEEVEPGRVVIQAEAAPHLAQQQGFAHGALTFAIGDSAAGYAALTLMPPGTDVLTIEMKINMLAPARGLLRAEGRVMRAGKRIVVVTAEVTSGGKSVALMQGTMIPVEGPAA
ncbi:PaaI family thioesterase [Paracoccus suum]|uniref:Medium/long-chain acyl-CoA thioesterase YigI n=1 Tax=Paracoccus suum TaxID=2259340 RepID=A0A344PGI5_9RHOB|nr:PaaI family thioesterase [Paracoccus suum]AXC48490.1 PaaI family thioesterase [Paracoccus suum]